MAIQGFTGPGYIGNFLSLSDLNTRYPPNQYTGRSADVTNSTNTQSLRYISDGISWNLAATASSSSGLVSGVPTGLSGKNTVILFGDSIMANNNVNNGLSAPN